VALLWGGGEEFAVVNVICNKNGSNLQAWYGSNLVNMKVLYIANMEVFIAIP
jgi:hypothetical protein